MQKNMSGQKWMVYAWNTVTLQPKTGDADNITAKLQVDGGTAAAVKDTNPTELEDGYYVFDITQAESNGDLLLLDPASTTENIQVGTIISAGSISNYAESFLTRAIEDARESTDEPIMAAKYSDSRIINLLEKAYIIVLNEVNRNSRTPAVAKINKTIVSGTTTYPLPHTVGSVHGIYKTGDTGGKAFYDSRSKFNPFGRGMWIENQTLHIQTTDMYGTGTEITIEYIPSGIARLHNGICTVEDADGKIVKFGATPNAGTLDTHHEAYAGSILRILGADVTGDYLQERVITAYDETTRKATLDAPLSPIPTVNLYYEIAPAISKGMDTVVALYAAWRIMSTEGNAKRASNILRAYRNEIRNVRLTAYYSYLPDAPIDRCDNPNNRRYIGR